MNYSGMWIFLSVGVIATAAYYIAKAVMDMKSKIAVLRSSKSGRSIILPLRLQAYERMALFL
ncbi:MAG: hypothetical protein SPL42_09490, partial [Bacteroidales bacterium]|nr:hypothetical protein [Bacteroidales bacterium]